MTVKDYSSGNVDGWRRGWGGGGGVPTVSPSNLTFLTSIFMLRSCLELLCLVSLLHNFIDFNEFRINKRIFMEIEKLNIAALHGQTQSQTIRLEERTLLITF